MNIPELRAEMARQKISIPKLADLINMNKSNLYPRMRGETPFNQKDIANIAKALNLSNDKIMEIFFTEEVA